MSFVPEWAPSVHPMIVHFPIALLFLAVLADVVAVVLRRQIPVRQTAAAVYALGAIAATVAFFTGRAAADGVLLPAAANPVLTDHADWALRTVWFYALFAVVRLTVAWKGLDTRLALHAGLLVIGTAGLLLVFETGEHGAEMVFRYGVGVAAMSREDLQAHDHAAHESAEPGGSSESGRARADESEGREDTMSEHGHGDQEGPRETTAFSGHGHGEQPGHQETEEVGLSHSGHYEDGGLAVGERWGWVVEHDAPRTFSERFSVLAGSLDAMGLRNVHDPVKGDVLSLGREGERVLMTVGPPLGSVQIDAVLNRGAFKGGVSLLHHVSNSKEYGFLTLDGGGAMRLGEATHAETDVQDEGAADTGGWIEVRLVADRTHFRGYINGKMIVHGHGPERPFGPVGLMLEGSGTVLLKSFQVTRLR